MSRNVLDDRWEELQDQPDPPESLPVWIRCFDENGEEPVHWDGYLSDGDDVIGQPRDWTPADGAPEPDVDPEALAIDAWNMITFPIPVGEAAPPLDAGTYAQLPTGFGVDDWETLTASASAGPVTSTVTATPVRQEWIIEDDLRDDYTFSCTSQGSPSPDSPCAWEPRNSSDGQLSRDGRTGEPCFDVIVLVEWSVTWTATGAPGGGDLGSAWMGSSTCIVVAEVQAVVDDA